MERQISIGRDGLRQSEERFKLLVESIRDYAIFMLDPTRSCPHVECRRGAFQGIPRPTRSSGSTSRCFIRTRREQARMARARTAGSRGDRRIRRRGLARQERRFTLLGERRHHGHAKCRRRAFGFAKVTRDLTQRRAQEEELRRSEERFRLLVEGVRDYAIFMLDANGRVVHLEHRG